MIRRARKKNHGSRTWPSLQSLEDRTLPSTTVALSPPPALSSTQWTNIGPAPIVNGQDPGQGPVSGRISGLAADPSNPNVIYIAASGGGVWKTTDGGTTWTPLTDNQSTLSM